MHVILNFWCNNQYSCQYYQQEASKLRRDISKIQHDNRLQIWTNGCSLVSFKLIWMLWIRGWFKLYRHMMGEALSSLPVKELRNLETKLEKGISKVRSKKVHDLNISTLIRNNKYNDHLIFSNCRTSYCLLKLIICRRG